jgi:hypothetical protein
MAIARVARRLGLTPQALMSFMRDRRVQLFWGGHQYTQSGLVGLVNEEQKKMDLEEDDSDSEEARMRGKGIIL